ncbi:MAG: hypothetical protein HY348_00540, partial [Nitrospira defluvii]|nr:hypothetical protein [Nitrospira defluvii]
GRRCRGPQATAWALGLLAVMAMIPPAHSGDIPLADSIPSTVYEIELTYVGEQTTPTVAFSGHPDAVPPLSYRPFVPILELQSGLGDARPFGPCHGQMTNSHQGIELQWVAEEGARCGQRIALHGAGSPMDLLSYERLRIRGRATGQVVVALEDVAGRLREDNVPLATVAGPFDVTVPLKEIGRRLDLRRLTSLVVSMEGGSAHIMIEQIEVAERQSGAMRQAGTGFWVWNYRAAMSDPEILLSTCRSQGCSRVLIQMPSQVDDDALWSEYARLLTRVRDAGIEAMALDGYPEAIQEPHRLADKIQRLLRLLKPGTLFGVQLDIEPYVLPGFLKDEAQLRRYLEAIETVKEVIAGRTRLSMVIPFWLASPTIAGRPLAYAVMDRADEVAVMSYRTDTDEVQDIAEDILRYGDLIGTAVWLALETTPLPVEQHVVLRRETQPARVDAVLDYDLRLLRWAPLSATQVASPRREWFRVHHRYTVRPERLTFAGRSRAEVTGAVETLLNGTAHHSFAGVIIHDLDGFRALRE